MNVCELYRYLNWSVNPVSVTVISVNYLQKVL